MNKKKKILEYLNNKIQYSVFEDLLNLYVSGKLRSLLKSWGLTHISLYIDWKQDYKCIDVQAKFNAYYYEWQFMENDCEYMIYTDGNEPDEATCIEYTDMKDLLNQMYLLIPF